MMILCCLSLLLAASIGLLITAMVPIAACGRVRSILATITARGISTSVQASSASTAAIVASVFLFVVFQQTNKL